MLKSMTGYGRDERRCGSPGYTLICEIRSVNGRFLNISTKLPRILQDEEEEVKKIVRNRISRGKINVHLFCNGMENFPPSFTVDTDLISHYLNLFKELKTKFNLKDEMSVNFLASLPGVFKEEAKEFDKAIALKVMSDVINAALGKVMEMKLSEGRFLLNDIKNRIKKIEGCLREIEDANEKQLEQRRSKLRQKVEGLLPKTFPMDIEERLELEILFWAERLDITEEIVRLKSHLIHFNDTLESEGILGSKLTYITQEISRETNTIASKSMDASISRNVILIKEECERIREQLQNVE